MAAVGDRRCHAQYPPSERPDQGPVELHLERAPAPGEVLVELALDRVQRALRLDDARRELAGRALEHRLDALLGERHTHETALGPRGVQRAERGVDGRVADVGEARFGGALAHPPGGRDGLHAGGVPNVGSAPAEQLLDVVLRHAITFLNLPSPSCSERRAASSEQPIAVAMSR